VSRHGVAPPPPPETFGAYAKKSGESGGVIQMIDLLISDLDKEMTESTTEEKDAQADYEQLMADSAEKRAADSTSLSEKEAAKADAEGALQTHNEDKTSAAKELGATLKYIASLHGECDWLVKYFDVRREARAGEVDSLQKAKAVLSGADFSLLQMATETCPSTSFECGMSKDAAGDTVFVPHELPSPDTCVNVASELPSDGEFKICGPGSFSLSRMSCDKHDYKAVNIVHPSNEFTASDCKVYKLADYYQIHGYVGSAKYSCDATAR